METTTERIMKENIWFSEHVTQHREQLQPVIDNTVIWDPLNGEEAEKREQEANLNKAGGDLEVWPVTLPQLRVFCRH